MSHVLFKEIKLPFPSWNPSICEHKEGFLCISTRWGTTPCNIDVKNYLYLLDSNFEVVSPPKEVLPNYWDPILLPLKHDFLIFANKGTQMTFSKVDDTLKIYETVTLKPNFKEKNWSPFTIGEEVYLIRFIKPFTVYRLDCDKGAVEEISSCNWETELQNIHGGTHAIPLDDQFLAICHTLEKKKVGLKEIRNYNVWAYTFSMNAPFRILRWSEKPILNGRNIDYPPNRSSSWLEPASKVIIARGLALQEENVVISYGEQDLKSKVAIIKKEELLNSMYSIV